MPKAGINIEMIVYEGNQGSRVTTLGVWYMFDKEHTVAYNTLLHPDNMGVFSTITAKTAITAFNSLQNLSSKVEFITIADNASNTTSGFFYTMSLRDLGTLKKWAPDEMRRDEEKLGSLIGKQELQHISDHDRVEAGHAFPAHEECVQHHEHNHHTMSTVSEA